jgi:hypothetical protein
VKSAWVVSGINPKGQVFVLLGETKEAAYAAFISLLAESESPLSHFPDWDIMELDIQ